MIALDYKHFVLEYYKNASDGIHIHKVHNSVEAKKLHTHEYFQIYYIEKGALIHYIENDYARLTKGDMFIIPPDAMHKIAEDDGTVFYALSFMPDTINSLAPTSLSSDFLKSLTKNKNHVPKITLSTEDILTVDKIIEQMYKEFDNKKLGSGEIIKAYILILISVFARYYHSEKSSTIDKASGRQFILHCIDYIENHYSQDINLKGIVRLSAMSKTNFCKIFSETTGCSFNTYLNRCRIAKATEYIKKGYKITSIYGLCGYNDFSTFNRNFNKIMGMSPLDYKQSNCEN